MNGRSFWWLLLVVAAACVVCMNIFCIPGHDELFYAFRRIDATGATCPRLTSFSDLIRQQIWDYQHYNARVILHGIVSVFAALRLYYLFDVINSAIWLLLVVLVYKETRRGRIKIQRFMPVFAFVFVFWWYAETVCMNAAFGVNYLWVAVATLIIMRIWRKLNSWWWIPVGFLYGWSHEGFSMPMAAALFASIVLKSVIKRRYAVSLKQTVFAVSILAGALCIVLSPAIRSRAGETMGADLKIAISIARALAGCVVAVWPLVLLLMVAVVFYKAARKNPGELLENCEWWLYLTASFGLFTLTCSNGLYRLAAPWSLAGIVLVLKSCPPIDVNAKRIHIGVAVVIAYLLGGTALQVSYGVENWRMLERYRTSPSGVTYRCIVPPLWYDNMCWYGLFVNHLNFFQWDFESPKPMSILSENLYRALYDHRDDFIRGLQELPRKGLFVSGAYPGLVVKKGRITDEDRLFLAENMVLIPVRKLPWFFPGRIWTMIADPMTLTELNKGECEVVFSDGCVLTLIKH